jgi:hypothetical protein
VTAEQCVPAVGRWQRESSTLHVRAVCPMLARHVGLGTAGWQPLECIIALRLRAERKPGQGGGAQKQVALGMWAEGEAFPIWLCGGLQGL